ncbi:hypothetical protein EDD17DRAFT_1902197 [Pisolithus thermaeus]|nr:hypothetical protein EDD17DRAFT_1902197 [Pisolithus thermaeus]
MIIFYFISSMLRGGFPLIPLLVVVTTEGYEPHLVGKSFIEYGARLTPRTNEERDVVMAWKTADDMWHQRTFTYLEDHYGPIPRPASWLEPEEAVQQSDSSPEWNTTGETTQNARDSDNRPPKRLCWDHGQAGGGGEIVDARQVETYLPVAEVGTAELERSNECSSALEVPGEHSQYTGDEVAGGWDLLESRSEAPKPAEDTSRLASGRSIESAPLLPIKDNQHLWTDDETVANVADPPGTHAEPPIPQIKRPTLQNEGVSMNA